MATGSFIFFGMNEHYLNKNLVESNVGVYQVDRVETEERIVVH